MSIPNAVASTRDDVSFNAAYSIEVRPDLFVRTDFHVVAHRDGSRSQWLKVGMHRVDRGRVVGVVVEDSGEPRAFLIDLDDGTVACGVPF